MKIVISYDIVDDKRRTRLAKKLCDFGKRVQYSVFECDLTKDEITKMITVTTPILDLDKVSLRIYKLCQDCADEIIFYGIKKGWENDDVIVI